MSYPANSHLSHYWMDREILCDYYQTELGHSSSVHSPPKTWLLVRLFVSDGNAAKSSTTVSEVDISHFSGLLT